jgi:hypothetical protein
MLHKRTIPVNTGFHRRVIRGREKPHLLLWLFIIKLVFKIPV